jgi:hypothetical protein
MPVSTRSHPQPIQASGSATSDSLSSTLAASPSPPFPTTALPALSDASSSSSDSSSDDSDDDLSSEEESDDEDDPSPQLAQLLLKAKQSARQRAEAEAAQRTAKRGEEADGLAENDDTLQFGEESDEEESEDEGEEDGYVSLSLLTFSVTEARAKRAEKNPRRRFSRRGFFFPPSSHPLFLHRKAY